MPIFQYYNPYKKPNFYNNYSNMNYTPNNAPRFGSNSMTNSYSNQISTYPSNYVPDSSSRNISKADSISQSKRTSTPEPISPQELTRSKSNSDDNVWLDLFGLKLYFDDVLILSLLFFLYKEEVKDEGLFLALVLLLIS